MPRIDLQVPFSEKDDAKRLGARWDAGRKVWYVPDGLEASSFTRWIPAGPETNIRSSCYYIAETRKSCWKCGKETLVLGLLIPAGHQTLEPIDEEELEFSSDEEYEAWLNSPASSEWATCDLPTLIHYVDYLPDAVRKHVHARSRNYRVDFSKTTQSAYWMNHCEHCGMKQGDFEMYCEPQGAFFPLDEREAAQIVLHAVDEPFEANCDDYSYGVELFDFMRKG